jgi:DNA-binding HxlR family transcriptional regulator
MPFPIDRAGWTPDPLNAECPSRKVIDLIADKWTVLVLSAIAEGAHRNGQLMRRVGGVTQKALTRALRDLERNGLVTRLDYQEIPPRVDYRLTDLGLSLMPLLGQLCQWAVDHMDSIATLSARETAQAGSSRFASPRNG